ncbi:Gfo/Idh/MocA family protein [Paenibacillus lautus]|uniref:Gfo/Idh/MocA family protein n=1 Tax=Paenibacillus lautus TaxID=1401 RepID=UPI003D9A1067
MTVISIGLIGCGSIAVKHIESIARFPEAKLAALCDVNTAQMKELADLWFLKRGENESIITYSDYEELLADPSIAIVIIATISGTHAAIAKAALQANKHIVLEKPAALSLQEVDELIQLAAQRKRIVQVCHQLRYRPLFKKIKELIATGALGKIVAASVKLRIFRPAHYFQLAPWRGTWEHDGGMLLNQGIHAIDLLQWNIGMPSQIYGGLYSHNLTTKETEDVAIGLMMFPNGTQAIIEANSVTPPENLEQSLFLLGDKGTICISGPKMERIDRWYIEGYPHAEEEALLLLQDKDEHVSMYRVMIDACQGKHSGDLVTLEESRRSLELIFALYSSATKSEIQQLPLDEFSTLQMKLK